MYVCMYTSLSLSYIYIEREREGERERERERLVDFPSEEPPASKAGGGDPALSAPPADKGGKAKGKGDQRPRGDRYKEGAGVQDF